MRSETMARRTSTETGPGPFGLPELSMGRMEDCVIHATGVILRREDDK